MTEFLALKQGNNTVLQYAQTFNQLSQYGGFHVDTDEKKHDCFRRGLSIKLQDKLALTTCNNFTDLVNKAITQEDATLAHKADKKRKAPAGSSSNAPQRYKLVQTGTQQAPSRPSLGRQATTAIAAVGTTSLDTAAETSSATSSTPPQLPLLQLW